jgi:hypothetical protein
MEIGLAFQVSLRGTHGLNKLAELILSQCYHDVLFASTFGSGRFGPGTVLVGTGASVLMVPIILGSG